MWVIESRGTPGVAGEKAESFEEGDGEDDSAMSDSFSAGVYP